MHKMEAKLRKFYPEALIVFHFSYLRNIPLSTLSYKLRTTRMLTRALAKLALVYGLCLLLDKTKTEKNNWRSLRNSVYYFLQHKYVLFRSSTCSAAMLPRFTHVRKTYHPFPMYWTNADFNLLRLGIEHPKSKSKGWKSNFKSDSVPDKSDYFHQVFCNFSSQLISACLSSRWESGNQHTNRREILSIITKWCGKAMHLYCALSHSSVPFKCWNSLAQ